MLGHYDMIMGMSFRKFLSCICFNLSITFFTTRSTKCLYPVRFWKLDPGQTNRHWPPIHPNCVSHQRRVCARRLHHDPPRWCRYHRRRQMVAPLYGRDAALPCLRGGKEEEIPRTSPEPLALYPHWLPRVCHHSRGSLHMAMLLQKGGQKGLQDEEGNVLWGALQHDLSAATGPQPLQRRPGALTLRREYNFPGRTLSSRRTILSRGALPTPPIPSQ